MHFDAMREHTYLWLHRGAEWNEQYQEKAGLCLEELEFPKISGGILAKCDFLGPC
jgi:hypothetical protein